MPTRARRLQEDATKAAQSATVAAINGNSNNGSTAKPTRKPKKTAPAMVAAVADAVPSLSRTSPGIKLSEQTSYKVAAALKMIAEPTRVTIVTILASAPGTNVTELCNKLTAGQPAVSHHLALMKHSGLVIPVRAGKNINYELSGQGYLLAKMIDEMTSQL